MGIVITNESAILRSPSRRKLGERIKLYGAQVGIFQTASFDEACLLLAWLYFFDAGPLWARMNELTQKIAETEREGITRDFVAFSRELFEIGSTLIEEIA